LISGSSNRQDIALAELVLVKLRNVRQTNGAVSSEQVSSEAV